MIDPNKQRGTEDCEHERDGGCYALLCYSNKKCRARNVDGTEWCWDGGEEALREMREAMDECKVSFDKVANLLAEIIDAKTEPEPKKATGWAGREEEHSFCIDFDNDVVGLPITNEAVHSKLYDIANKFTDDETGRDLAERISKQETLMRQLQRFSDENGGQELVWDGRTQNYYIYFDQNGVTKVDTQSIKQPFRVYFKTPEICRKAIELFGPEIKEAWGL